MPWIERVRTEQPLDAGVGIDWANPLTRGMVSALHAPQGGFDAVTGERFAIVGTEPAKVGGPSGIATRFSGTNGYYKPLVHGGWPLTHFCVFQPQNLTSDQIVMGSGSGASAREYVFFIGSSAGDPFWSGGRTDANDSFSAVSAASGAAVGAPITVASVYESSTSRSIFVGNKKVNNTAAVGATSLTGVVYGCGSTGTPAGSLVGDIFAGFVWTRGLSDAEILSLNSNPWQIFAKERIWVPAAAGGDSTITQADGTSTASSLGGSATAATTPAAADGTSTAASIAASATAAAAVTQADGASTAATLVGVASTGSTITQADGSTVASVLAGSATSSAAATQADGVSTVGTLAGSATAASVLSSADGSSSTSTAAGSATSAAALTQADGLSTVSTLTGAGTGIAAFTQADGVSTTGTLTGTGLAAGSSTITPAAGSTTAGAIAGSSTAIAAITQADGTTTAGTLSSSSVSPAVMTAGAGTSTTSTLAGSSIFAAAMTQASGATTASAFAASAVAACVAIAAAGASSAQALAGIPPNTSSLAGIVYEIPEDVRSSTVLADARGFTVLEDVRARPRPYNGFNYR